MPNYIWHGKTSLDNPVWKWIAWKLPKPLIYWCAIRLIAFATTGKYGKQCVPELAAMDALKRWDVSRA